MEFEITIINPTTGEPESQRLTQDNCWQSINSLYSKAIPEKKLKPVNFKLELLLDSD